MHRWLNPCALWVGLERFSEALVKPIHFIPLLATVNNGWALLLSSPGSRSGYTSNAAMGHSAAAVQSRPFDAPRNLQRASIAFGTRSTIRTSPNAFKFTMLFPRAVNIEL